MLKHGGKTLRFAFLYFVSALSLSSSLLGNIALADSGENSELYQSLISDFAIDLDSLQSRVNQCEVSCTEKHKLYTSVIEAIVDRLEQSNSELDDLERRYNDVKDELHQRCRSQTFVTVEPAIGQESGIENELSEVVRINSEHFIYMHHSSPTLISFPERVEGGWKVGNIPIAIEKEGKMLVLSLKDDSSLPAAVPEASASLIVKSGDNRFYALRVVLAKDATTADVKVEIKPGQ